VQKHFGINEYADTLAIGEELRRGYRVRIGLAKDGQCTPRASTRSA